MNNKRLVAVCGLLLAWAGTCSAAPGVTQGVIRFQGSIVEPGCTANVGEGARMQLKACPAAGRNTQLDVHSVQPVSTVTALGTSQANVKWVSDTVSGRYYDQRYVLVDNLGKPIQSGVYVVTLTSP